MSIGVGIRYGQEAVGVAVSSNSTIVITRQGQQFTSKYVIMAIPPVMAGDITYSPPLPREKITLLRNMKPIGDDTKFVATYNSAFWRAANLAGNTLFRTDEQTANKSGKEPIINVVTMDTATAFGSPALVGYYISPRMDSSESARKTAVLDIVARLLNNNLARNPIEYREFRWNSAVPFNKGGAGNLGVS